MLLYYKYEVLLFSLWIFQISCIMVLRMRNGKDSCRVKAAISCLKAVKMRAEDVLNSFGAILCRYAGLTRTCFVNRGINNLKSKDMLKIKYADADLRSV